jgi:hypothetical protein
MSLFGKKEILSCWFDHKDELYALTQRFSAEGVEVIKRYQPIIDSLKAERRSSLRTLMYFRNNGHYDIAASFLDITLAESQPDSEIKFEEPIEINPVIIEMSVAAEKKILSCLFDHKDELSALMRRFSAEETKRIKSYALRIDKLKSERSTFLNTLSHYLKNGDNEAAASYLDKVWTQLQPDSESRLIEQIEVVPDKLGL